MPQRIIGSRQTESARANRPVMGRKTSPVSAGHSSCRIVARLGSSADSTNRFPFHFRNSKCGMRNKQVPYRSLKSLSVSSHGFVIYHWHQHASVGHPCGVPSVSPDYATDFGANFLCILEGLDEICANISLRISTPDRKHKDQIVGSEVAAA